MATHNQFSNLLSLGKLGDLLFARQKPMLGAETHPGTFANLASGFKAWRERRAAVRELAGLSDRDLADIGITRQEIPQVVARKR